MLIPVSRPLSVHLDQVNYFQLLEISLLALTYFETLFVKTGVYFGSHASS